MRGPLEVLYDKDSMRGLLLSRLLPEWDFR